MSVHPAVIDTCYRQYLISVMLITLTIFQCSYYDSTGRLNHIRRPTFEQFILAGAGKGYHFHRRADQVARNRVRQCRVNFDKELLLKDLSSVSEIRQLIRDFNHLEKFRIYSNSNLHGYFLEPKNMIVISPIHFDCISGIQDISRRLHLTLELNLLDDSNSLVRLSAP